MDLMKIGLIAFVSKITANEDFQNAEIMLGWFSLLFSMSKKLKFYEIIIAATY